MRVRYGGREGDAKIYSQPSCFPGRSSLWVSRANLIHLGWDKGVSWGKEDKTEGTVRCSIDGTGGGCHRCSIPEVGMRLRNCIMCKRGRGERCSVSLPVSLAFLTAVFQGNGFSC